MKTTTRSKAAWFVNKKEGAEEDWTPLWRRDSEALEEHYQSGDRCADVPVQHRRAVANIAAGTVTEAYYMRPKVQALRRGTWFWESSKGAMPFSEETADALDHWSTAVKMSKSSVEGRWQHDLGEVMGPGQGQFTIVGKLVRSVTPPEEGKGEAKEVEVVTAKSSDKEIALALNDADNRFIYVLENRTNMLTSMYPSMKVQRGFDLVLHEDERIADTRPGHLVFIVHGIGEAMFSQDGSPLESIQTCTKKFRAMSMELTHPTATDAAGYDICGGAQAEGGNKMVEYLPIEWWDSVHGDDNDMTKQMKRITAPTVPLIRQFGNTAVMDVLMYQTPEFQDRITSYVSKAMNHAYSKFCELNPDFSGDCSIIGHSLGSVISFDILSAQFGSSEADEEPSAPSLASESKSVTGEEEEEVSSPVEMLYASQSYTTEGKFMKRVASQQLVFKPRGFYAVGSPIGAFFNVRSKGRSFPSDFTLPTCEHMYNVFHPHDPVAYRLEPLFDPDLAQKEPFLIDHITGMTLHNRVKKFGAEVAQGIDTIMNPGSWFSSSSKGLADSDTDGVFASWFRSPDSAGVAKAAPSLGNVGKKPSVHAWSSLDGELEGVSVNKGKRVDYVLQETTLEVANQYMSALFAHSSYFDNKDFLQFTLTQIANQNKARNIKE